MSLPRPIAEGWALLAPLTVAALVLRRRRKVALALAATAASVAAFLRDPDREPSATADALAPADGRVVDITRDDRRLEITIFLALWHVHVQRAPLAGRVERVVVTEGGFKPALFADAADNHRQTLFMSTDWGPCEVDLIAGLIARRIVRWVQPGEVVAAGQRLGMIKFGSRVVLRLPAACTPLVSVGQEVRAALTPVARLPSMGGGPRVYQ